MTSEKDFDLSELKQAMDTATPAPSKRAEHIALAERTFADYHDARQGTAGAARPMETTPSKGLFSGAIDMLMSFGTKGGLTATTALVATGFLFFTPQGKDLWQSGPIVPGGGELTVDEADFASGAAAETEPEEVIPAPVVAPAQPTAEETAGLLDEMNSREVVTGEVALLEEAPAIGGLSQEVVQPPMVPAPAVEDAEEIAGGTEHMDADGIIAQDGAADVAGALAGGALSNLLVPETETERRVTETTPSVTLGLSDETPEVASEPLVANDIMPAEPEADTETFANEDPNAVQITVEEPVSTFSIDVDTAAYAVVRQSIFAGQLPPVDAVRIEEMVNYFPYDYAAPDANDGIPFRPNVTVMPTPWNEHTRLVHIGLQGIMPATTDRAPLNLVFLIDTSGSMNSDDKLGLLRQSFLLMLPQLRPEDEVAIVTYAGSAGLALPSTPASDRTTIEAALDNLTAGGSTNGQGGLEQAYAVAESMTAEGEVSRVILATDGDFNVGLSDPAALEDFIADQRDSGTYLSVLGFGRGNLDDATMQALAQNGNGIAAYIDTLNEAQKVLVDQLTGALFAIAEDVKVQVEWNPGVIAEYRLIGYETRALAREDFNNDRVDAGELGAGHSVTAIYEVTPVGSPALLHDPLRYQAQTVTSQSSELGFLRLRWKEPGADESQLYELPITDSTQEPGTEAQFATAVAGFGQLLRGSDHLGDWGWDEAIALATASRGEDPFGYRNEAVRLMHLGRSLSQN